MPVGVRGTEGGGEEVTDLPRLVNTTGCAAHAAYSLTLRGDIPGHFHERYRDVKVGDTVLELSTFYFFFVSSARGMTGR